jgi:Putative MetA-pathway of phenol degradation
MARAGAALVVVALMGVALTCEAQDLEPRAYSNTPVGMNFLILGYSYTRGDVAFDASTPIEDAELTAHSAFLAYAHAFGVWGRSAKLDLVLPYAWVSGTAEVAGQRRDRYVAGFGDARVRFSGLLYGGPALSLAEFEDYKPDLIVGASLAITLPVGQYDSHKLVNVGTNRWSVKPELGISKTFGPVTLELAPSVTFYTDNNDFLDGKTLEKDPLYALQAHAIYHTRFGLWAAVDATYYTGGRTTIDGERGEEPQNLRLGATLAIPINRHNSVKLYASTGAVARVGGNFTTAGVAWQFRWGGGL